MVCAIAPEDLGQVLGHVRDGGGQPLCVLKRIEGELGALFEELLVLLESTLVILLPVDENEKGETDSIGESRDDRGYALRALEFSTGLERGQGEIYDGRIGYAVVDQRSPGVLPYQEQQPENVIADG